MKTIDFYKEVLGKYRCHYNFSRSNPFNIQCYTEKDPSSRIYKLIEVLNVSIDSYLALMIYEIESCGIYTLEVDITDCHKIFLNNPEFLDLNIPVKIKFTLKDYSDEVSYDIKLEDLINSLIEYKNKYSMFSDLEIWHDYDDGRYKGFLKGCFYESPKLVSSRAVIIEKYSLLTVELEKEIAIIDKEKEDDRRNKYLKLKEEFESNN